MSEHKLTYSAGIMRGFELYREPGWRCTCGNWRFQARPMPRRKTGNNEAAGRGWTPW